LDYCSLPLSFQIDSHWHLLEIGYTHSDLAIVLNIYVIKFVNDLWQVGDFIWVLPFPLQIKQIPWYYGQIKQISWFYGQIKQIPRYYGQIKQIPRYYGNYNIMVTTIFLKVAINTQNTNPIIIYMHRDKWNSSGQIIDTLYPYDQTVYFKLVSAFVCLEI
jgi:hypothetical protein